MPTYYYRGVDKAGGRVTGHLFADDEASLDRRLRATGVWVVHASTKDEADHAKPGAKRTGFGLSAGARRKALIDFCTMMYFQTKAGVPLVQALESLVHYYEEPQFRAVLSGVQRRIEGGDQFYQALAHYPTYFTPEFVGIIKVGESSGHLPPTFLNLRNYLDWVHKAVAEARQATLYPTIVFVIICVFVLFLFTAVVPKFATLLERLNLELPLVTQVVFGTSKFFRSTWYIWATLLILLTVGAKLARAWSPQFVRLWDQMKLKLPLFGDLNYMIYMSRFSHNLLVMYRAGIPILQALEICETVVGNRIIAEAVHGVRQGIERGDTLTQAMERNRVFPPMLLRMVHIGESTGNLDGALEDVADFYTQTLPARIKKLLTVLEPLLMVGLIGIVLIVALAIYQPLIALVGSAKKF
jgi:type II secretory pathway component PulF